MRCRKLILNGEYSQKGGFLGVRGGRLGIASPAQFFWVLGVECRFKSNTRENIWLRMRALVGPTPPTFKEGGFGIIIPRLAYYALLRCAGRLTLRSLGR